MRCEEREKSEFHGGDNTQEGKKRGEKRELEEAKTGRGGKKEEGKNVEQGEISSVETMCVMYTRYVKEAVKEKGKGRGVGADLSCGSICEHVTHMERPLYA